MRWTHGAVSGTATMRERNAGAERTVGAQAGTCERCPRSTCSRHNEAESVLPALPAGHALHNHPHAAELMSHSLATVSASVDLHITGEGRAQLLPTVWPAHYVRLQVELGCHFFNQALHFTVRVGHRVARCAHASHPTMTRNSGTVNFQALRNHKHRQHQPQASAYHQVTRTRGCVHR